MPENAKTADPNRRADDVEADLEARLRKTDLIGALIVSLPKWMTWAIVAWQARLSIEAMAGKNALASFLMRFGREASYWELVCWTAALLGILFGMYNRHLLHLQTTKDTLRAAALEKQMKLLFGASGPAGGIAIKTTDRS